MALENEDDNIPLSSTDAEHITMAGTVKCVLFGRQIFSFMQTGVDKAKVVVHEDHSGAIHVANSPMSSARLEHIDLRHHFVREIVRNGDIRIVHIDT